MAKGGKTGRPTKYTKVLGDKVCSGLAGGKSLVKVCEPKNMPCTSTIYGWLRKHEEFLNNYIRAREDKADHHFDELVDLADDCVEDHAAIQKARLQIDTRKWAVSKMNTKKYGNEPEDAGKDEAVIPQSITVNVVDASKNADA